MFKIISKAIAAFIFTFFVCYISNCQWSQEQYFGSFKRTIIKNGDTAALIGFFGEFYLSFDQGINWQNHSIDYNKNISNVQILNDSIILLAIFDTIDNFFISHNFGIEWETLTPTKENISDLYFFGDTLGFLAANNFIFKYNTISQKVDTIWNFSDNDSTKSGVVYSLLFINDSVGYANGGVLKKNSEGFFRSHSFIMKTIDYGNSWNYILISDSIKIYNSYLSHLGNSVYTYFGLNIVLIDTLDNYSIKSIPNSMGNLPSLCKNVISSVSFINKNVGFVTISPSAILFPPTGDAYDQILKTEDGGKTWKRQYIDTSQLSLDHYYPTLTGLAFFNDSVGLSCGYDKILSKHSAECRLIRH
jgi:hypothetical protein